MHSINNILSVFSEVNRCRVLSHATLDDIAYICGK